MSATDCRASGLLGQQLEVAADDSNGLLGLRAFGSIGRGCQVTVKDPLDFDVSADETAADAEVSRWSRLAVLWGLRGGWSWVVWMGRVAPSIGGGML